MKRTTKKLFIYAASACLLTNAVVPFTSASFIPFALAAEQSTDFSVGQGIEWPVRVNAPYADLCAWVNTPGYNNSGCLDLGKVATETGVNYFNLAFIQSAGSISGNKLAWGWGGYSILSEERGKNDAQYLGIKKAITDVRALGGDVCVSFGGASGTAFWQTTQDVDVLYNTYLDIVNGYKLTRIDLDVEGGAQNKAQNVANAKAIKKLQATTDVDVVLTLPVLPDGLTYEGLGVLDAYLSEGVALKAVNIMTMCYGESTLKPGENYGSASVRAVNSLKDQLISNYAKYSITLTDTQAYEKIGTTVSIGYESGSHPIFTTAYSELVVNHAIESNLGMTSFWSINRDTMTETNQGISSKYAFTNVFKQFGSNVVTNGKPVISGVSDKQVALGSTFDPLSGVSAFDREDGNLTSYIVVTGSVNTSATGTYNLSYSVSDLSGQTTTATCTITVSELPPVENDTYDNEKVYFQGDTVIYNGQTYVCKWWTVGEAPGSAFGAWELVNAK